MAGDKGKCVIETIEAKRQFFEGKIHRFVLSCNDIHSNSIHSSNLISTYVNVFLRKTNRILIYCQSKRSFYAAGQTVNVSNNEVGNIFSLLCNTCVYFHAFTVKNGRVFVGFRY